MFSASKTSQDLEFSSSLFRIDEDLIGTVDQFQNKPGVEPTYWKVLKASFNEAAQTLIDAEADANVMVAPATDDNLGAKLVKEFTQDRGGTAGAGREHILQDYIYEIPINTILVC